MVRSVPPAVREILASARQVVRRPRLFALLDAAAGRLTVVTGPAGSGKTLLAASWLRDAAAGGAVAWVAARRDGADARRFWTAVTHALSTALTVPVTLVLDDVDRLDRSALARLTATLANCPETVRVVLVGRGLTRARLPGDRLEIRGPDLAFTAQEAAAYLRTCGIDVPDTAFARLMEVSEGWVMGLRLAVGGVAGERAVAEYLAREVLSRQSPGARRMLLRTSVLEYVNGSLGNVLGGTTNATGILRELEDAVELVHAVDAGRSWFRYHPMLAATLRQELRRRSPGELDAIHRLAARWYANHGFAAAGTRHASAGHDWNLAGGLLKAHWLTLLRDGERATVEALLLALPAPLAWADAELAAIVGAGLFTGRRLPDADAWLDRSVQLGRSLHRSRRGRWRLTLAVARRMRADRGTAGEGAIAAFERAPQKLPTGAAAEPPPGQPLTERELTVLRYLPTHLTAGEIAGALFLSVHTVKSHMRSLYRKLGVHRRGDAVRRARALGLLEPRAP